jgi:tetratricopeptide (TPR) repeat protein
VTARHLAAAMLGALLYVHPAWSQDAASTAEARVHFDRAIVLFESGNASGALAEFQRAHDLSGRASVLYNIGATYQALHDYPQAIEVLRRFLAEGDGRSTPNASSRSAPCGRWSPSWRGSGSSAPPPTPR